MKKHMHICIFILFFFLTYSTSVSTVDARTIKVESISPNSTISAGTPISFYVTTSDYARLQYTIHDSLPGSTISNAHINNSGRFEWTPTSADVGSHNLTITSVDTIGNKDIINQTIVVREASSVKIIFNSSSATVLPGNAVSFSVASPGYSNPTFFISNSFSGGSLSQRNVDSYGNINWIPNSYDVGQHNIEVRVRSSTGREDIVYQTIIVKGVSIKEFSQKSTQVVRVGSQFSFSVNTYGMQNVSYRVRDSLRGNTIDSMQIQGNTFTWTPTSADVGVHNISIVASSEGNNPTIIDFNVQVLSQNIAPTSIESDASSSQSNPQSSRVQSPSVYTFTNNLSSGSRGVDVIELQKELTRLGFYNGPTNGSFGPLTKSAVIKYQTEKGVSPIGVVGPATRALLNKR